RRTPDAGAGLTCPAGGAQLCAPPAGHSPFPGCRRAWSRRPARLRACALDGRQAEDRLHEVGITVDRNAVPDDPRPPMVTSGLRIGAPALATRGFTAEDFAEIADVIAQTHKPASDTHTLKARVTALAHKHPL
ncbi:hypothetical protein QA942_29985, partial [Streptomyces sp. B21-106]